MGTKWTKEQKLAIDTRDVNLLIAAAAGSGKTAVLVERIIKMITNIENPIDIDRLLVVTFTNAAASEMRERIGDAISKKLENNPESQILQRQLSLLNRANITTMHSFCLDVIKNNFHLIDLDPGFRIGDDTECMLIKQDILIDLFEDKYSDEDKIFLDLVEAYGGSKSDDNLYNLILKLYHFSMSGPQPKRWLMEKAEEFNVISLDKLDSMKWSNIIKQSISVEVEGFYENLRQGIIICENTTGLNSYIENLSDDRIQLEKITEALNGSLKEIYNVINEVKFSTLKRVKKSEVEDTDSQEKVKSIRDNIKRSINKFKNDLFGVSIEESLIGMKKMYPLIKCLTELVIEFTERYNEKKREKGILDFNDLEHLCLKVLIKNIDEEGNIEPSSVSENFREKFEEILVDEYQDSNLVQETIINMVSRKNSDKPNVFMVGDVKQSIYRFRQAKPELFLEKYNTYKEVSGNKNRKIMLYKNFRSRREVIEGVNFIFKSLMSEIIGELRYDEKEALNLGAEYKELTSHNIFSNEDDTENINLAGNIEVHILDKSIDKNQEKDKENSEEENNMQDEEEDLDSIQLEARIIIKRIKELMEPKNGINNLVWDKSLGKYRKIKYNDIVILLRATKNWADTFVEELGLEGIPIYADTGTGYFQSIEVRTIISLLHIIDNPMQDVHILSSLRSPIFAFNVEELGDIRLLDKSKYFYENIKDIVLGIYDDIINKELKSKCEYFFRHLDKWREKSLYTPIDEFIWHIYTDTSYYGYVGAMPNGIQRQANLRILFQRAKQYEQTSFKGLFNFINFINKLKKSSGDLGSAKILGENENVVRIMSIHKSKGLEFPVVFLSGCGKQFNLMDLRGKLLFHESLGIGADCIDLEKRITYPTLQKYAIKKKFELETLSEEMRILYVAFTRAKEKLIITGAVSNIERACSKWCKAAASGNEYGIPPSRVLTGKSYLDWIGMALARHPQGIKLREGYYEEIRLDFKELSTWNIDFWKKSDLIVEEKKSSVDKIEEKKLFIDNNSTHIEHEIKRRLEFKYKYKECCEIPSNVSVSDLKKAEYEDELDQYENMYKRELRKKPNFIQDSKGISAAEKGTIMHFIMQNINLEKIYTINDIKIELKNMIDRELLTEEQHRIINPYKIKKFFESILGKELLNAYINGRHVYRELPFITEIQVSRVKKNLDNELYKNENLRLQGIIDCFFEDEEGGVVLLDYKTDYVEEGNEEEIIERYKVQMNLYSETLEKILGKKVKRVYLYLFSLDKEIEIK